MVGTLNGFLIFVANTSAGLWGTNGVDEGLEDGFDRGLFGPGFARRASRGRGLCNTRGNEGARCGEGLGSF